MNKILKIDFLKEYHLRLKIIFYTKNSKKIKATKNTILI